MGYTHIHICLYIANISMQYYNTIYSFIYNIQANAMNPGCKDTVVNHAMHVKAVHNKCIYI